MTFYVLAGRPTETNVALVSAIRRLGVESTLLRPEQARRRVRAGDVALGRVDVLPTLDGVEACLWERRRLERHGVRVLNGAVDFTPEYSLDRDVFEAAAEALVQDVPALVAC